MFDTTQALAARQRLTRIRNLALQGAAELCGTPAASRRPALYSVQFAGESIVLRQAGHSGGKDVTDQTLADLAASEGSVLVDLVFTGASCIDIDFRLPDGLLPELRQMVEREIQFRSPFSKEASLTFWETREQADGRWQTRAAVTLREPVERVMAQLQEHGLRIHTVRRESAGRHFAALPAWAGDNAFLPPPREVFIKLPAALRAAITGSVLLLLSALILAVQTGFASSRLEDEAQRARTTLAAQAQDAARLRALQSALARGGDKMALTGLLSTALPDGVWLDQLIIEDDSVTLVGYGPSAADVTRLLSDMPELTDVAFASPVTRDNTQSLERFRIAARLAGSTI